MFTITTTCCILSCTKEERRENSPCLHNFRSFYSAAYFEHFWLFKDHGDINNCNCYSFSSLCWTLSSCELIFLSVFKAIYKSRWLASLELLLVKTGPATAAILDLFPRYLTTCHQCGPSKAWHSVVQNRAMFTFPMMLIFSISCNCASDRRVHRRHRDRASRVCFVLSAPSSIHCFHFVFFQFLFHHYIMNYHFAWKTESLFCPFP